ncbi:hypothetical protein [Flavobacterium sp.]|uniref:hypothetical protein n=1 Tax=Flavobacterium sp. TaxID=239 RepID=UPI0040478970
MARAEKQTYKVAKSKVNNDEKRALQLAVQKTGLGTQFLKAEHTEKTFVFVQIR